MKDSVNSWFGPEKIIYLVMIIFLCASCQSDQMGKHAYFGETPPDINPKVFAPNKISKSDEAEFGSIFNADGNEFYFGVDINGRAEIRLSKLENGGWTEPEVFLTDETYSYNDPYLSLDESKLYFISDRQHDGKGPKKDYDIWYVERNGENWTDPKLAEGSINTKKDEYYISIADNEKMYFASNIAADSNRGHDFDVYSSALVDGKYEKAYRLGGAVNSNAYEADVFIAPDESYLIFSSVRRGGYGRGDLYISFKNPDGTSTEAVNMGLKVNSDGHELCPVVTRDGKYFFYSSNEDIYWVSTDIFDLYK